MKLFESRHARARSQLSRRVFLKAVGAGLSVPLAYQMSQLAVAQTGSRPNRLFVFYLPHGAPVEHFDVSDMAGIVDGGPRILDVLSPYKNWLQVLRNVGITTATNHAAIGSTITGSGASISIDRLIAQQTNLAAHSLGVMNFYPGQTQLPFDANLIHDGATYVSPVQNPADALDALFEGIGGEPVPVGVDESQFRAEAIDLNVSELETMKTEVTSLTTESNKLQAHIDALLMLKAQGSGGPAVISCDTRPALPSADSMAGKDAASSANFTAILDGHLEATANAFICSSKTKIVTLQNMYTNAQIRMDFDGGPGIAKEHHDPISHSSSGDSNGRGEFREVIRWFYSRLGEKFLKILSETNDPLDTTGARKVLDNTTVLVCSEICDGSEHNSDPRQIWINGYRDTYLPWLLIGGGGGYFKTNTVTTFSGTMDHRNVLAAVAASMGVDLTTFGGTNVSVPTEMKA